MLFRDKDGDTVGREREKESRKGRTVFRIPVYERVVLLHSKTGRSSE